MLQNAIFIVGIGQIILVVGSLAIPRILNWSEETSKLRPLTRQVFWTYAGYILATNLSFALVSMISPASLIDGSFLATSVTLYIFLYWLMRVVIQFTWFDHSDLPAGFFYKIAEWSLVGLFVALTIVYGLALCSNLTGVVV